MSTNYELTASTRINPTLATHGIVIVLVHVGAVPLIIVEHKVNDLSTTISHSIEYQQRQ